MAQASSGGSSSSNSLFWMMLAAGSVFMILLGGGIFVSSRVLSSMGTRAGADTITAHTPTGDFRVEKLSEIGPGLPLYPRAALLLPGTNADEPLSKGPHVRLQTTTYYTEDTRDLVDSWYLQHLGPEFVRHKAGDPQPPEELSEVPVPTDSIAFAGKRGEQVRIVSLTSNSSGTRIMLLRFAKHQAE
jgi:hypothetical protein